MERKMAKDKSNLSHLILIIAISKQGNYAKEVDKS